jgi:hypothetical protein
MQAQNNGIPPGNVGRGHTQHKCWYLIQAQNNGILPIKSGYEESFIREDIQISLCPQNKKRTGQVMETSALHPEGQ